MQQIQQQMMMQQKAMYCATTATRSQSAASASSRPSPLRAMPRRLGLMPSLMALRVPATTRFVST